jgi:hypothetical protein
MSPASVQNSPVKEVKTKAPRKPTLAAKYNKMLVFGYTLAESLRAKGVFSDELVEHVFSELHLMSSVDDQVAYYESVLSQAGANAKVMKKYVVARNKPVKEPKVRKPRAKKSVTVQSDASDEDVIQNLVDAARDEAPKVKKPRKNAKKAEVVEAPVAVPEPKEKKTKAKKAEVVEAPVAVPEPKEKKTKAKKAEVVEAPVAVPEPKEKKTKAKKAEVVEAPVAVPEPKAEAKPKAQPKAQPKAEAKPKAKAEKAKAKTPEPVADSDDDDEEEILTKETSIDGVPFLIDQHNNLYDPVSHEFVRKL